MKPLYAALKKAKALSSQSRENSADQIEKPQTRLGMAAMPNTAVAPPPGIFGPGMKNIPEGDTFKGTTSTGGLSGVMGGLGKLAAMSKANPSSATPPNGLKKGGKVKSRSASKRADGIAQRGKTRGRYI